MKLNSRITASAALGFILALSFLGGLPFHVMTAVSSSAPAQAPIPGFKSEGVAPGNTPVTATIAVPLRNTGLLSSLVEEVSNPASPLFLHYLTRSQIANEFLPTAQFSSTLADLESTGLHVELTAMSSMIVVQGTAEQLRQDLGAAVNLYTNGTESYYMGGAASFEGSPVYASNASAILARPQTESIPRAVAQGNLTYTEATITPTQLQQVYNATGLYAKGDEGQGQTVGLLDFYGSPTISTDLSAYDRAFGLPQSPFQVVPIGAYDPNLGVVTGWSLEATLDVEMAHAAAPRAGIDMYAATNSLPLSAIIATIVGDDSVTSLSQSFGYGEWQFSVFGSGTYNFYVTLTDQYYMLGNLEGISFTSSSGDGGGDGFSAGPAGSLAYPSSSPYVTSVGGTQTYIYTYPNGTERYAQTAWSPTVGVPDFVNTGGSAGGVSILEPKPWYQAGLESPSSYVNGRIEPDLSLQAGINPATLMIYEGAEFGEGGTSESSPLLAGMIALIAQSSGRELGNINPFLYSLGDNSALYKRAFTPITVGYNIPWTASYGYNLVTGWGAPNVGEMAHLYQPTTSGGTDVSVNILNVTGLVAPGEFVSGQSVEFSAWISDSAGNVTTGFYAAHIESLQGSSQTVPLYYNTTTEVWDGIIRMGIEAGTAYLVVNGTVAGRTFGGFAQFFAGYIGAFLTPSFAEPWSNLNGGISVDVNSSTLSGQYAPAKNLALQVNSYSILGNRYTQVGNLSLPTSFQGNVGYLTADYPTGPMFLAVQSGVYGYLAITDGVNMQETTIWPPVLAAPAAVAPGQSIAIFVGLEAPINLAYLPSTESGSLGEDIAFGSNVSAYLLDPSGSIVSSASLKLQGCSESICLAGDLYVDGYLDVPSAATPGLYTILLNSTYSSEATPAPVNGSFYEQILVASGTSTPKVSFATSTLYEGQNVSLSADIRYPNGSEVTQGEYSVSIYPEELHSSYNSLQYDQYVAGTLSQLTYDPTTGRWEANITLPSAYDSGALSSVNDNSLYYAGPYDAYVSGVSWDGVPTVTVQSAQQSFFVQPFVLSSGQTLARVQQTFGMAFSGDKITGSANLTGDVFLGLNTLSDGTYRVSDSQVQGTLNLVNSTVILEGDSGGAVSATGTNLTLSASNIGELTLTGSHVRLVGSSFQGVSPAPPTIGVGSPVEGGTYSGMVPVTIQVGGATSTAVYLDGQLLGETGNTPTSLNASALQDGEHALTVVATQSDGLSWNKTVVFSTDAQLSSARQTITTQGEKINGLNSSLSTANSELSSQSSRLSAADSSIGTLTFGLYFVAAVALVGVAIAVLAVRRRGGPVPSPPMTSA